MAGEDTGADDGFDPDGDILPDEILDRHMTPDPGADDEADDEADLDDDDLEDDDLDGDDESDGDEDPDDEADDFADDEEQDEQDEEDEEDESDEDDSDDADDDDEDDDDDVLETLTAEERKAIERDPRLRKTHKLMQRAFTKKMQGLADREQETDVRDARLRRFEEAIQTPEGMQRFLERNLIQDGRLNGPAFSVVAKALETVGTGEAAQDFLIEVGLHNPEVFQKAADRVQELLDDEDELNRHKDRKESDAEKARLRQERLSLAQERFDREAGRLMDAAIQLARQLRVDKEDMAQVREAVATKISAATKQNGSVDLDRATVRSVVKQKVKEIEKQYERARKRGTRRQLADQQKSVKRKAARSKKRGVVPRGGSKKPATKRAASRMKVPSGKDPLDHYIDVRLGLD